MPQIHKIAQKNKKNVLDEGSDGQVHFPSPAEGFLWDFLSKGHWTPSW